MFKSVVIAFKIDDYYTCSTGALIDESNAIFIEESRVKLVGVVPSDVEGVFFGKGLIDIGMMRQPIGLEALVQRLKDTNMYDYLLRQFDRSQEVDFDLL